MPLSPLLPCCPSIDPVTFVKLAAFVWSKESERGVAPLHSSLGFSHYLDLAVESEKLLSLWNTCSIGDPQTGLVVRRTQVPHPCSAVSHQTLISSMSLSNIDVLQQPFECGSGPVKWCLHMVTVCVGGRRQAVVLAERLGQPPPAGVEGRPFTQSLTG